MHLVGNFIETHNTTDGQSITFLIDDVPADELETLKEKELFIDVAEQKHKRSLNANAYFWKLCSLIGQTVGCDKDTVYLMLLKRYGVFETIEVVRDALPVLAKQFAYVEVIESYTAYKNSQSLEMVVAHCFYGSHDYTTAEFARLIDGTVSDCADLKIPTLTDKELEQIKQNWRR